MQSRDAECPSLRLRDKLKPYTFCIARWLDQPPNFVFEEAHLHINLHKAPYATGN